MQGAKPHLLKKYSAYISLEKGTSLVQHPFIHPSERHFEPCSEVIINIRGPSLLPQGITSAILLQQFQ